MVIRVQRHANVSKQTTLLEGVDVVPLKLRVCGYGLNWFVHEGMNDISNVKVHLKTHSGCISSRWRVMYKLVFSLASFLSYFH